MNILEELIWHVFDSVKRECSEELKVLNHELAIPKRPFPRLTYDEVLEKLEEAGERITWGDDLSTPAEKKLAELIPGCYFVVDWPLKIKPFYTGIKPGDSRKADAFDLMYGELELSSGGTRIHSDELLMKQLKEKGMNPENFESHLMNFKYGALPPHAGFGLGLDRLTMVLTGADNIRECVLFPRDRRRLSP